MVRIRIVVALTLIWVMTMVGVIHVGVRKGTVIVMAVVIVCMVCMVGVVW